MKSLLLFCVFVFSSFSYAKKWQTFNNPAADKKLKELGAKSAVDLFSEISEDGVKIRVLDSGRKAPKTFTWGEIQNAEGPISRATQYKNLMGKTFCQGEQPIAEKADNIILAHDAPRITLLHEYLHILQIRADRSWCALSKELWKRQPTELENRQRLDREWDVLQALWKNKAYLQLGLEDEITLSHELTEQAQKRASYDPSAVKFIQNEKVLNFLQSKIQSFQSGAKKKPQTKTNYMKRILRFIDKKSFSDPKAFKDQAYCYFVFQDVIDEKVLNTELFQQYVKGGSLSLSLLSSYKLWLNTEEGKDCKKKVGNGFQILKASPDKEYAILLNEKAIKDDGKDPQITMNHEILHIAFAKYPKKRKVIEKVWAGRSEKMKNFFINDHPGYDFSNEKILLREFFSYTFQKNVEVGLGILMKP